MSQIPAPAAVVAFPTNATSLADAYGRGLPSAATRRAYRTAIQGFAAFLQRDLLTATRRDVEAYRAQLEQQGRSAATVAKAISALTGLFAFAVDEGLLDRNPALVARRPRVPTTSPRLAFSTAEVKALLAIPDPKTMVGLRDRAMLTTLVVQGWRISEVLGLRVEDLTDEAGHSVATITGKGGKQARVPLAAAVTCAIRDWLTQASIPSGPAFAAVTKGGRVVEGSAISPQAAWKRLQVIAEAAGIQRKVHAHLFRHGAVTTALAHGVPLHQVQDFARHADPRTTRRYDSHRMSLNNPAPHVVAAAFVDE